MRKIGFIYLRIDFKIKKTRLKAIVLKIMSEEGFNNLEEIRE